MILIPHRRSSATLRWNAGCRASAVFGQGTAMIGRPSPTASFSRPSASVSLMPWASLLTVLKVAGAITNASAGGSTSGSAGSLYRVRTGCPVSSTRCATFRNLAPAGVVITQTSQPCCWAAEVNPASSAAGLPPDATTYRTGYSAVMRTSCASGLVHEPP